MSHILAYDGQFFRVETIEVANSGDPDKAMYVSWCSDAFKELKDMPRHALSRFIAMPPMPNYAEARRHADEWIKKDWNAQKAYHVHRPSVVAGVVYTVWLFKGDNSLGYEFEDFSDAKMFAKAAEKNVEITKVLITNNESPQSLTIWERPT